MGLSLVEARENEAKAREVVRIKILERDATQDTLSNLRRSLQSANTGCEVARNAIDGLQSRLAKTKDDLLPNEALSRRARLDLETAQAELATAREERIAAEAMLVLLEKERDQAEQLLNGARENVERSGEYENSSMENLSRNQKIASDAQHAVDDALRAIEEAKAEVESKRAALLKARAEIKTLPQENGALTQAAQDQQLAIEQERIDVEQARSNLEDIRKKQADAEVAAKEAKEVYDRVQEELKQASTSRYRCEAALRLARQLPGLDNNEREALQKAERDLENALARQDEVRESNKRALSDLADADVEAIRLRIAADEAQKKLTEAEQVFQNTQKVHHEICEEIVRTETKSQASSNEVAKLEEELREATERLERLESEGRQAEEQNQSAQEGLKSMREIALRYGRESRNAMSIMDGRRHKLSDILSAIEVSKTQLESLKRRESESAARVDAAFAENQKAYEAVTMSRSFIVNAERDIEQKKAEVTAFGERIESLKKQIDEAEEALMRAQTDVEVAQSDLTDAEVSVIMAEISANLN